MNFDNLNIAEYLLAGTADESPALLSLNGCHTYGDLRVVSSAIAAHLIQLGAEKGDRVLLMGENSLFWVGSYLGTLRAGLVSVPIPTATSPKDCQFFVEHTSARFALVQAALFPRLANMFSPANILVDRQLDSQVTMISLSDLLRDRVAPELRIASTLCSDLAALMFTSGSTGQPQAVMISHGNIRANTESIVQYMSLTAQDRVMLVLPLHYCFGTSLLHTHLRVGGSLVLDSQFMYPETVLDRMQETKCTGFAGVPSHYQILLDKTSLHKRSLPYLRYVQQAGGPLSSKSIQRLRETLPRAKVFVMYGQTEATARLSFLPPELLDTKLGSIGKGIPGVRLRVENEGRPVRPGEIGEIVAEGENIGLGYWQDPIETACTFRDGRLYTGDMASVDEDGFVTIVSRSRDFVKCGGTRKSCRQLEQQILECCDLEEVAVLGVPDSMMGEAVKAFVVPRIMGNISAEQVKAHCKMRLPLQFVPREVVVLGVLPKSDSGKVLKEQLRHYGE